MQKLSLTVTDVDGDGDLIPVTTLVQADFKFIRSSDNVTEITFSNFTNNSNGNYLFWGFDVDIFDPVTNATFAREQVRVKINDVFQDGYGIITIYHDDDEPAAASYSVGRVDRQGDTVFYWLTYVPDDEHDPPFDPYDPDSAAEPDNVLVCNKYVKDNFGQINASNDWANSNTHDFTPTMASDSTEFMTGNPTYDGSLVWRKWVEDNYGSGTGNWDLQANELLVDKSLVSNIVGKKYNNLNTAIAYAQSQSPTNTNKWKIYIMPYMIGASQGYADNITLYPNIDLIGIGQVKLSCGVTLSGTWTGQPKSFWKNIDFERINTNQTFQGVSFDNCNLYNWNLSSTHTLTLTTCQLRNTGLYAIQTGGTAVIASGDGNRVINCYGNYDVAWAGADKMYGYTFVDSLTEYWFNGTTY